MQNNIITFKRSLKKGNSLSNTLKHVNKLYCNSWMSVQQPNTKENEDFFNVSADIGNEGLIDTNSSVGI